jgi:hypothetical protein
MLTDMCALSDFDESDLTLKIKFFIIFSLFFAAAPSLKNVALLESVNNVRRKEKNTENLSFCISIRQKKEIFRLLILLFNENLDQNKLNFCEKLVLKRVENKTNIKIQSEIQLKNVFDLLYLFNSDPFSLNVKSINLSICLFFDTHNTCFITHKNFIRLLPFFWSM